MDFGAVSWPGVILAAVAFFAVGGVYYGPLFGETWMRAAGMTEEEARESNLPLVFGATFLLEAIAALGLAAIVGEGSSPADGAWTGGLVGVLIVLTTLGVNALYERRTPTLWALNSGYNVLGFVLMGAILGWLQ